MARLPFLGPDLSTLRNAHERHIRPGFERRENDVVWEARTLDGERTYP